MIDRVFFGRLSVEKAGSQESTKSFPLAKWQEKSPAIVLALIIVFFGLLPNFATKMIESSAQAIAPNGTHLNQVAVVQTR
jgi:NAD(P)H-quinone oxidoreductase subunit 4